MNTRTSKIARLPKALRHQLSQRIEDGQPGTDLVQWLNNLPEVRKITADQFNGSLISEQNLSDWKSSGHQDWLRRQEAREAALQLLTSAEDLDLEDTGQQRRLLDNFAAVLAVEMSRMAMTLLEKETDPEKKWKRLCEINTQLSKLRRDHDRATRAKVTQEKWNAEAGRQKWEEERQAREAEKQRLLTRLQECEKIDYNSRFKFESSNQGRQKAELYYRLKCDLPVDNLVHEIWPELDFTKIQANRT